MSWTDERVELLRQHWTEGKSASQIAGLLGHGLTRNAIIGKVHRLGLAGRAKAPGSSAPRPRPAQAPRPQAVRPAPQPRVHGATALAMAPAQVEDEAEALESVVLPMSLRVTIVDLRETMCKLAARRSDKPRVPLLRLDLRERSLLRPSQPHGLSARA